MTGILQPWKSSEMILADGRTGWFRLRASWVALIGGVVLLQVLFARVEVFPALWDTLISQPIDGFQAWARDNRLTHPVFTGFFIPLSDAIEWALITVESFLQWLPWYVL
ncbi:MAG TPA: hypothetical protein VJQ79_02225, partial [Acidimicrobiia bacterium]|nr:hypothetical protein [Acidimicrobiia bacterium]